MSISRRLKALLKDWDLWASSANREEDGWESTFPCWNSLVSEATKLMSSGPLSPEDLAQLERCWLLSEESEDLATFAEDHFEQVREALYGLAHSSHAEVRWQVYAVLGESAEPVGEVLRKGLRDEDQYCRRRAILALAKKRPPDALEIAGTLVDDNDPYIRQAAISLIAAAPTEDWALQMLRSLVHDTVAHVRNAAQEAIESFIGTRSDNIDNV